MKNSVIFLIIMQLCLQLICFETMSQNTAISEPDDVYWDEQFGDNGMDNDVYALTMHEDILYAVGDFTSAGFTAINRIAKLEGSHWSAVGSGFDESSANAVAYWNSNLYAGGDFYHINGQTIRYLAKWDGTEWTLPGTELDLGVLCLLPAENELFVGGGFVSTGSTNLNGIAGWDGSQWYSLGGGMGQPGDIPPLISSMTLDGSDLYVAGDFTKAGDKDAFNIARWDGTAWWPVGIGMDCYNCSVSCIAFVGEKLYAAGRFGNAGGVAVNNIAQWDGNQWLPLGDGLDGFAYCMAVIGDKLFVGGKFTHAGGIAASRIAMWDGQNWSALGSGLGDFPRTLYARENILYVGGRFSSAGDKIAHHIARWTKMTLSVDELRQSSDAVLLQNSPNPFIELTGIRYELKKSGHVILEVSDFMGREIKTLVDENQSPGEHQVTFNAEGLPAGVYFCQLKANGTVETKKMILIK